MEDVLEAIFTLTFGIWWVWIIVFAIWWYRRSRHTPTQAAPESPRIAETPDSLAALPPYPLVTPEQGEPQPYVPLEHDPLEIAINSFILWCKRDVLLKLGGLFVLIAAGLFVYWGIRENVIERELRILLGMGVGLTGYVLGWFRVRHDVTQGAVIAFVGATVMAATLLGAQYYAMFPPLVIAVALFLIAASLSVLAARYRRRVLGAVSVLVGAVTPLMISTVPVIGGDAVELSSFDAHVYLLALSLGGLWLVYLTGWRFVLVLLIVTQFFYASTYSWGDSEYSFLALMLSFLLTGMFLLVHASTIVRDQTYRFGDMLIALTTGGLQLVWILQEVESTSGQVLCLTLWALILAIGAYAVHRLTGVQKYYLTYGALAALFLAVATGLQFDGPALYMAFTIETTLLVLGTHLSTRRIDYTWAAAALMVVPLAMSLRSIASPAWKGGWLHDDFLALVTMTLCLTLSTLYFVREHVRTPQVSAYRTLARTAGIAAFCYLNALIWLVPEGMFRGNLHEFSDVVSLILSGLLGISLYLYERRHPERSLRVVAYLLLGFVIVRLLLVELWSMDDLGRIITFFVLGCVFMSTVWLERTRTSTGEAASTGAAS